MVDAVYLFESKDVVAEALDERTCDFVLGMHSGHRGLSRALSFILEQSRLRHNDAPDQRACFLLVWSRRMLCYGFFRKLPARKNQNSWMDLQRSG
jgi:hypothetical protein